MEWFALWQAESRLVPALPDKSQHTGEPQYTFWWKVGIQGDGAVRWRAHVSVSSHTDPNQASVFWVSFCCSDCRCPSCSFPALLDSGVKRFSCPNPRCRKVGREVSFYIYIWIVVLWAALMAQVSAGHPHADSQHGFACLPFHERKWRLLLCEWWLIWLQRWGLSWHSSPKALYPFYAIFLKGQILCKKCEGLCVWYTVPPFSYCAFCHSIVLTYSSLHACTHAHSSCHFQSPVTLWLKNWLS